MNILNNRYARVVTVILLVQAGAFYAVASRPERTPTVPALASFPSLIGSWLMTRDVPIEKEVQDILNADDTLNRVYNSISSPTEVYLFIAYFKTQRYGQSPHSPKNCLPGSGWEPIEDSKMPLAVPGESSPITINKYVVAHGDDKSVTLYWYQSHGRVIASEFSAKFWLVADAIRYHRSDTALVKVIVPIRGNDIDAATQLGTGFIQSLFPPLLKQLPM
jgi:EpsI family protein